MLTVDLISIKISIFLILIITNYEVIEQNQYYFLFTFLQKTTD